MVSSTGADSMPCWREHAHVVLDVLADLEDRRVLQQRLQLGERRRRAAIWLGSSAGVLGAAVAEVERALRPAPGVRWPSGR